jgi:hypothetical protein
MKATAHWQMSWLTKEVGVDVTIECRWTKEQIEKLLLDQIREQGLMLIPHPKKNKDDPDKMFVWPRSNKVKVRARAVIDPNATPVESDADVDEESADVPEKEDALMDLSLLPDGANVEAIRAIERAAKEDPLEAAAKKRKLSPGESRGRDD